MELAIIGFLLLVVLALLWERDSKKDAARREEYKALAVQIERLNDRLELMGRSQQARMNYESLENVENMQAQTAAAMNLIAGGMQLLQSGIEYGARAHNPKNGNGKKGHEER